MELRQLEYFMAVCREMHFTRAAEKLGVAQPTLSQQIRMLEANVGTPLFDRVGRSIVMTEAGETLLHYCYNIFHELAQARAALSDLQGLTRGTLKIGALLTVVDPLLAPTVRDFHKAYPNIELSIFGLPAADIFHGLWQNELDFGIVYLPVQQSNLAAVPLREVTFAVATPAGHSLTKKPRVSLLDLKGEPLVLLPASFHLRRLLDEGCAALQFAPRPIMEMTTLESMLNMVANGVGVTVLPRVYLEHLADERLGIAPIKAKEMCCQIGVVYRRNKFLCAASRVFMDKLTAASGAGDALEPPYEAAAE